MEEKNINIPADVSIKIFNAVKEFNFGKIAEVMEFLDWQYALPKPHYPDEDELSNTAFHYLMRAYNGFWESENKHEKFFVYEISTGGFEYSYWYDFKNEEHYLGIKFVVEEYRDY